MENGVFQKYLLGTSQLETTLHQLQLKLGSYFLTYLSYYLKTMCVKSKSFT